MIQRAMNVLLILVLLATSIVRSSLAGDFSPPAPFTNNGSLVEYPIYSDPNDKNSQQNYLGSEVDNYIRHRMKTTCLNTSIPFAKILDTNQHRYFPKLPLNPDEQDTLGTFFMKEKNTGLFFVQHWPQHNFPAITFYVTNESEPYRNWITEVVENVNKVARQSLIISSDQKLIDVSNERTDLHHVRCNQSVIHVSHNTNVLPKMMTKNYTSDTVAEHLGQFTSTDIIVFIENEVSMDSHMTQKAMFETDLTHEMLHALGLDHNFSLGTIMDYNDENYNKSLNELISNYETDVLRFLFTNQKSDRRWALTRVSSYGAKNENQMLVSGEYDFKITQAHQSCADPNKVKNISSIPNSTIRAIVQNNAGASLLRLENIDAPILPSEFFIKASLDKDGSVTGPATILSSSDNINSNDLQLIRLKLPTPFYFSDQSIKPNQLMLSWDGISEKCWITMDLEFVAP